MDFEKRIKKVIDNLSVRYDFFYLIKKNRKTSFVLFLLYLLLVIYVIEKIYIKHNLQGIIDNLLPLFVDIAFIFLFTVIFLIVRTIYNDEDGRIDENKNDVITQKIFLNFNMQNIKIQYDKNNYYAQPLLIKNLLKWVDFDKDDYFRTHYGAIDITKISLKKLEKKENELILKCNQSSFYDIVYTHYFPDYILSLSRSTDAESTVTLRNLLKNNIEGEYTNQLPNNGMGNMDFKLELCDLLPNPIGITGIVTLKFSDSSFYLLQKRHKSGAAAKDKVQWSFAGTIDSVPNLYKDSINFKDLIENELEDEVKKSDSLKIKFLQESFNKENIKVDYKLIGFVLNPLYLYQPEFFVNVIFNFQNDDIKEKIKDESIMYDSNTGKYKIHIFEDENFYTHINDKNDRFIIISDIETLKHINKDEGINTRNLFDSGLKFLENIEKYSS